MKRYVYLSLKVLLGIGILASLGANAYFFGFLKLKEEYQKQGAEMILQQVVQAVKQNGSVKIGDVNLMAVPKQENPKQEELKK